MHQPTTPYWLIVTAITVLVMSGCSKDTGDHPLAGTPRSDASNTKSSTSSTAPLSEFNVPPAVVAENASKDSQPASPDKGKAEETPPASKDDTDAGSAVPGFPGPMKTAGWQTSPTRLDTLIGPLPAEWRRINETTSSMEKIAFSVFAPDGGVSARLSVFSFPEAPGNTVEANIRRWRSQFRNKNGAEAEAYRLTLTTTGKLTATVVGMQGTYTAMGATVPKPDQSMLTTIVKTPGGTVFIRLLGTELTVKAAASRYRWLIQNLVLVPSEEELSHDSE